MILNHEASVIVHAKNLVLKEFDSARGIYIVYSRPVNGAAACLCSDLKKDYRIKLTCDCRH